MPGQSVWPLPHDVPYTALIDRHLMGVIGVPSVPKIARNYILQKSCWGAILLRESFLLI